MSVLCRAVLCTREMTRTKSCLCNPLVGGEGSSQARCWSPGAVTVHGPHAGCALLCSLKCRITPSCKGKNWGNMFFFLLCSKVACSTWCPGEVWHSICHSCLLRRDRCERSFHVYHGGTTTMCVPDYWQRVTPKVMECK